MTIDQLIKSGKLAVGTELIWARRGLKTTHKAKVLVGGKIQTADGQVHKTPSGAAKHLNGNKPVDGWLAWKTLEGGKSLAEIRLSIS
jgi:hypothetical protein